MLALGEENMRLRYFKNISWKENDSSIPTGI
jgi:hypothetical protein